MKRLIIVVVALIMGSFAANAQNTMVVNSETIFRSMPSYLDAMNTLDKLAQQYQTSIDNEYEEIEKMFVQYQNDRPYLSEAARVAREEAIIAREKQVEAFQERIFGQEGELLAKRVELIKPIQDRVFETINSYAERNGYQLVLDTAGNPTILYNSPSADKTNEIINILK